MKFLSEKSYHRLFYIGIVIKGLYSIAEFALGALFVFFNYATLYRAAFFFMGDELAEGPVVRTLRDFAATPRSFWAFLFISHAIVKLFLTWGLLRDKLWAYPLSAAVFALFIVSQLYQMAYTPSLALSFITVFDVALIALILREYKNKVSRPVR
jgi:uncharacterized membrane protein